MGAQRLSYFWVSPYITQPIILHFKNNLYS